MELSQEIINAIRDYASNFTSTAYERIKKKAFYHAELRDIFVEKSIHMAKKTAITYIHKYSDDNRQKAVNNYFLSLVKNYLVMNYASFSNYITRESGIAAEYKENIIRQAKRDYYLKHLTE